MKIKSIILFNKFVEMKAKVNTVNTRRQTNICIKYHKSLSEYKHLI